MTDRPDRQTQPDDDRRRVVLGRITGVRIREPPEFVGAARGFTGIRLGGVVPCAIALTTEFAPWNRRQLYNGVMLSGSSLGAIVASFVAVWLLPDYGWRSLYVVAFAFIVLVPMMYSLVPESVNALISRGRLDEARAVADRYGVDFEAGLREHAAYEARGAGRGYALAWISRAYVVGGVC